MKINFWLILIIFLAAVLRIFWIDKYPAGFTPDEASFGYDAYSILKTGKDQWGESFPLAFRSFGDFKAPLYTYLTIPSVAVFGLNEFAVRLPNAILGVLAVLVVYLLVKELFSSRVLPRVVPPASARSAARVSGALPRVSPASLGLLAALLLAISPWHVSLSRGAFEANLTTFLMPLGVWAFLKGGRWTIVSALAFGLNLFSYHSAKLITPLWVFFLIWWKKREHTLIRMGVWRWAGVIFLAFLTISIYTTFTGGGARGADIGIFNPTGGWGAVADRRYEAVQSGLPDEAARFFSNKITYTTGEFVKNYLSYLSPTFLFTQGAGEATYGMIPGFGVLYLFELPFIILALWSLTRDGLKNYPHLLLIVLWVLLSPIPAALTKGPGFAANRAAVAMPAIQILSAYGAVVLWQVINRIMNYESRIKNLMLYGYGIVILLGFMFFLEAYLYHGPRVNAHSMSYGWKQAMDYLKGVEGNYGEIVISRAISEPHIFVAFYNKWNPSDYQKESRDWLRYEKQGLLFVDQLGEYKLGKYTFRDIRYQDDSGLDNVLLIGRAKDFAENVVAEKKIFYPDGKPALVIIDPQKQNYAKAN